jgi:two-component system, NtrC family, response regulator HydG
VLTQSHFLSEKDFTIINGTDACNDQCLPDSTGIRLDGALPLDEVEKATILNTLEAAGGNKSEAARRLGITRKTLHKKLKTYGVMP